MAEEHVIGDMVEHLGPIDDSPHGLVRRFPSSVVALIVERSRNVRGHGLWDPKQLVGSARNVDLAVEESLMQH